MKRLVITVSLVLSAVLLSCNKVRCYECIYKVTRNGDYEGIGVDTFCGGKEEKQRFRNHIKELNANSPDDVKYEIMGGGCTEIE